LKRHCRQAKRRLNEAPIRAHADLSRSDNCRVIRTRAANDGDRDFLADMLVEAINWNPDGGHFAPEVVLAFSQNARYVVGWPRSGDFGLIAETTGGRRVGAAWWRHFSAAEPGYGYLADDVPEVSIGVVAAHRGRGIGDQLLTELEAAARDAGVRALSLSVEPANPARRLYERHGFRTVGTSGGSETMWWECATR
jgi:ribosomal protein S18 acetylase RimI-like enzyme